MPIITNNNAMPHLTALLEDRLRHKPDDDAMLDRARGAMLGLACGNALGVPVEMWWRDQIQAVYPGGVREINWPADYVMDDDLAQAAVIARALIRDRDIPLYMARRMVDWFDTNGHGCGNTTYRVVRKIRSHARRSSLRRNPFVGASEVYDETPLDPNGGVMRCAPVAIARLNDPAALMRDSAETCAVTHWGETVQWSCVVINTLVASLILDQPIPLAELMAAARRDGMPDLERLANNAFRPESPRRKGITSDVFEAISAGRPMPDDADWLHPDQRIPAHALIILQAGLWAAETSLNLEDALIAVVSAGGDCDTNGALAGAVLGARYGASAIPARWIDAFSETASRPRSRRRNTHWDIRPKLLSAMADRMLSPEHLPTKPHENTHWVAPGTILAGEYPRNLENDAASREKLKAFTDAGFQTFIDFTREGELSPYAQWLPDGVRHVRIPVRDLSVPESEDDMRLALDLMDESVETGKKTYVHCWGGIGRTGTAVGCWLARHESDPLPYPANKDMLGILEQLDEIWQDNAKSTRIVHVPETEDQKDYILGWMG